MPLYEVTLRDAGGCPDLADQDAEIGAVRPSRVVMTLPKYTCE